MLNVQQYIFAEIKRKYNSYFAVASACFTRTAVECKTLAVNQPYSVADTAELVQVVR